MSREPARVPIDEILRHDAFVRGLARSLLRDEHLAEDVVQETFYTALSKPPERTGRTRSWLATVVRNAARMKARRKARQRRREATAARPEALPATADLIEQVDLHRQVVDASLRLDEPYRSVLLLRHFEELSHAEIAERLGVPLETMRTRLKRARQMLADSLRSESDEAQVHRGLAALAGVPIPAAAELSTAPLLSGVFAMSATKLTSGVTAAIVLLAAAFLLTDRGDRRARESSASTVAPDAAPVAAVPPEVVERSPDVADPATGAERVASEAPEPEVVVAEEHPTIAVAVRGEVVDDEDRPVGGARVLLCDNSGDSTAEDRLVAEGRTDERGRFVFDELDFHARHARASVTVVAERHAVGGVTFTLPVDDPVVVRLERETLLIGRVVDDVGAGIADARVSYDSVIRPGTSAFDWYLIPDPLERMLAVTTGPDGRFELPGLPTSHSVNVSARAEGYAGQRRQVPMSSTPRTGPIEFRMPDGAGIRGRVAFADGRSVAGAQVALQAHDATLDGGISYATAVTDADGDYEVRGLNPGMWNVFLDLPQAVADEGCVAAKDGLELAPGQHVERVDFVVEPGVRLVIDVVDLESGEGLADVHVGLISPARPRSGAAVSGVLTDTDGHAEIRVPAGDVRVYLMSAPTGYTARGESHEYQFTDEVSQAVRFSLRRLPVVEGRTVDAAGRAVAGVRVYWELPLRMSAAAATSDSEGRFELPRHPMGTKLRAETDDLAMPHAVPAPSDGEPLTLVLHPRHTTGTVFGRILLANGLPAAGAQVDLIELPPGDGGGDEHGRAASGPTSRADAEGRFSFDDVWPGNRYRVSASLIEPGAPADESMHGFSPIKTASVGVPLDLGDVTVR